MKLFDAFFGSSFVSVYFEHPYADEAAEKGAILTAANRTAARETASRSMVLLKNERETLR
jgi:beta-glucosidase-like glycosyl hydrolase